MNFFGQQSCGDGRILSLAEALAACTSTDGLGLGGVDKQKRGRFSLARNYKNLLHLL